MQGLAYDRVVVVKNDAKLEAYARDWKMVYLVVLLPPRAFAGLADDLADLIRRAASLPNMFGYRVVGSQELLSTGLELKTEGRRIGADIKATLELDLVNRKWAHVASTAARVI
jgi:hypothetical protein